MRRVLPERRSLLPTLRNSQVLSVQAGRCGYRARREAAPATNGKQPDGVRHEKDGDTHGWLKLDAEFQDLLNAGNQSDEGGNMVFEIVCYFLPVTQADAKPSCVGYKSSLQIPPIGSHVRVVGTYVQDTNHARWMEIHPVTSITVIE